MTVPVPTLGGADSYREQWLENQRNRQEAEESNANTGMGGDTVDLLQMGALEGAAGMLDFVGAEEWASSLNNQAQEQLKTMTPEMQEALSKSIVGTNENGDIVWGDGAGDWKTITGQVIKTAGMLPTMMVPGGALGKVAQYGTKAVRAASAAGKASTAGRASAASGAAKQASSKVDDFAALAGQGVAADAVVAGISEGHLRETVMGLTKDQLNEAPGFGELYWDLAGDEYDVSTEEGMARLSDQQRQELWGKAQYHLAKATEDKISISNDPLFHLFNIFGQGGANLILGKAVKGGWSKTASGGAASAAASEGALETAQGAMEHYSQQKAMQHVDPTIDPTEGTLVAGLNEGVIGGAMGAGAGAVGGFRANKEEQAKSDRLKSEREADERTGILSQEIKDTESDYQKNLKEAHQAIDDAKVGKERADKYVGELEQIKQSAIDLGLATEEDFGKQTVHGLHAKTQSSLNELNSKHELLVSTNAPKEGVSKSQYQIDKASNLLATLEKKKALVKKNGVVQIKNLNALKKRNKKKLEEVETEIEAKSSTLEALEKGRAGQYTELSDLKKKTERRKQQERVSDSELSVYLSDDDKFYVHDKDFNIKEVFDNPEAAYDYADPGTDTDQPPESASRPPVDNEQEAALEQKIAEYRENLKKQEFGKIEDSAVDDAQRRSKLIEELENGVEWVEHQAIVANSNKDYSQHDELIAKAEKMRGVLQKLQSMNLDTNLAGDTVLTDGSLEQQMLDAADAKEVQPLEAQGLSNSSKRKFQKAFERSEQESAETEQRDFENAEKDAYFSGEEYSGEDSLDAKVAERVEENKASALQERLDGFGQQSQRELEQQQENVEEATKDPATPSKSREEIEQELSTVKRLLATFSSVPDQYAEDLQLLQEESRFLQEQLDQVDVKSKATELTADEVEEISMLGQAALAESDAVKNPAAEEVTEPETPPVQEPATEEVMEPVTEDVAPPEAEEVAEPDEVVAEEYDPAAEWDKFIDSFNRIIKALNKKRKAATINGSDKDAAEVEQEIDNKSLTVDLGKDVYHFVPNGTQNGSVRYTQYHFKDGVFVRREVNDRVEKISMAEMLTRVTNLSGGDLASVSYIESDPEDIRKYGEYSEADTVFEKRVESAIEQNLVKDSADLEEVITSGEIAYGSDESRGGPFANKDAADRAIKTRRDTTSSEHKAVKTGKEWFIYDADYLTGSDALAHIKGRMPYLGFKNLNLFFREMKASTPPMKTERLVSSDQVRNPTRELKIDDSDAAARLDEAGIRLYKNGKKIVAARNTAFGEGVGDHNLEEIRGILADYVSDAFGIDVTQDQLGGELRRNTGEYEFNVGASTKIVDGGVLSFDTVTNEELEAEGITVSRDNGHVIAHGVTEGNYENVMHLLFSEGLKVPVNKDSGSVTFPLGASKKIVEAHNRKSFGEREEKQAVSPEKDKKTVVSEDDGVSQIMGILDKDGPTDAELLATEDITDEQSQSDVDDILENGADEDYTSDNFEGYMDGLYEEMGALEFSKGGKANTKTTIQQLNNYLSSTLKRIGNSVRTVGAYTDLPDDVRARLEKQLSRSKEKAENIVNAFYDPTTKTSYIIANRVDSKSHAESLLAHEVLGHHRFEEMADAIDAKRGVESGTFMGDLKGDLQKIIESKSPANKKLQAAIKEIQGDVRKRYTSEDEVARETVSHLAERYANSIIEGKPAEMSGFKAIAGKIAAMVRNFIREKFGVKMAVKETDLMLMLAKAGRHKPRGKGPGGPSGGKDIRFSLTSPDGSPLSASERYNQTGVMGVAQDGKIAAENVMNFLKDATSKAMPLFSSMINRSQWGEMLKYKLPQIMAYHKASQDKDAYRSGLNIKDDKVFESLSDLARKGQKWGVSEESKTWSEMVHKVSIYQVDPTAEYKDLDKPLKPNAERKVMYGEVKAEYDSLPKEWKDKFSEIKKNYKDKSELMFDALKERAEDMAPNSEATKKLREELDRIKGWIDGNGPYFPLRRFGNYIVVGYEPSGEKVVQAFEKESHATHAMNQMKKDGFDKVRLSYKSGEVFENVKYDGTGSKLLDIIDDTKFDDPKLKQQIMEDMNLLLLRAMPDSSIHKNIMMNRKGVKGHSEDAIRAFAASASMMNAHIANIKHDHLRRGFLDEARKELGKMEGKQIIASHGLEAVEKQYKMDQQEIASWASTAGQINFTWFIGPSIASAIVNTTQTPLVSLPMMAGRFGGYGKATKALTSAMNDYMKGKKNWETLSDIEDAASLTEDERKAIIKLKEDGVIDMTQTVDLTAGGHSEQVGGMGPSATANRTMRVVGAPFHYAEVFNRQVTALAVYRLARKNGSNHDDAIEEARTLVYDSHFDYSSGNRASIMKGNLGRVLLQFKQYPQGITYVMARSLYMMMKDAENAIPADAENRAELLKKFKEEKHAARVQFTGMMVGYGVVAGAMGLPIAAVMDMLQGVSNALGDEDDPWDWKTDFMNAMSDNLGEETAQVLAHGIGKPVLPFDVSSRLALDSGLWVPRTDDRKEGADAFKDLMFALMGPTAANAESIFDGIATAQEEGNMSRGVEKMLPKALKDVLKTIRYADEQPLTKKGDRILDEDLTFLELAFQAAGFTPDSLSRQYFKNERINFVKMSAEKTASKLKSNMVTVRMSGDRETAAELQSRIDGFNRRHPKMRITHADIRRSINARKRGLESTEGGINYNKKTEHFRDQMRF